MFAALLVCAALSPVMLGAVPPADEGDPADVLVVTNRAMGVEFQITLVMEPASAEAVLALANEAQAEVARLERVLNNWSVSSDISELNATLGTEWLDVDADLAGVLSAALAMHAWTDGAYDVTVLPLGGGLGGWWIGRPALPTLTNSPRSERASGASICRFGPIRPASDATSRAWRSICPRRPRVGRWDRVVELLRDAGVTSAFVAAGASTVAALGSGVDGEGWPFEVAPGVTWRLVDQAVSTSGRSDAGLPGGAVMEHILDPRTGMPASRAVRMAVFVGPSATEADMASTALVVLGRRWRTGLVHAGGSGPRRGSAAAARR